MSVIMGIDIFICICGGHFETKKLEIKKINKLFQPNSELVVVGGYKHNTKRKSPPEHFSQYIIDPRVHDTDNP